MSLPEAIKFAKLSWWLLEQKFLYYRPGDAHPSWASADDAEFDAVEREYIELASRLGAEPTVHSMVGFDDTRPSSKLVMEKLQNPRRIDDVFS